MPAPSIIRITMCAKYDAAIQQSRRHRRNGRSPTIPSLYPWVKLARRWIEHAGFEAGQRVRIAVEQGRLTITAK
ncbi:SymE family type I addiction module toxin [Paraburkholderia sp. RL17-373-BIF-A]|uniref:SymE family type I addiction module toxin n=1 Tax=Paraburkholderia sp. RL17-373-BIF-A TaxID=3031629 RepID=UPI0038B9DFAF